MKAKSIKGKTTKEIEAALEQTMADGFKPTLAIAFISLKQDRKAICEILDAASIAIYGATTNGEFIDEETEKDTGAIPLLYINKNNLKAYIEEYHSKNYRAIEKGDAQKTK